MSWQISGVQIDCTLGQRTLNLDKVRHWLREAAKSGSRLIVFPECVLTGYGFTSRDAARDAAEPLDSPSTQVLSQDCRELGVWAVVGTLERAGEHLFNTAILLGPAGELQRYRKVHLPCVGADRFTDPGDEPFKVHDLGGLKVGLSICFDMSFPETARIHTLLGADLLILPTNWADKAIKMATLVPRVRAFENHVYNMCVNRVGLEAGYHYIGHSTICDYLGDWLAVAEHDRETIVTAAINPQAARAKKVVHCVGEYEIDRVHWRRPELYDLLTEADKPFLGHYQNGGASPRS